jgi:hypothetical protein
MVCPLARSPRVYDTGRVMFLRACLGQLQRATAEGVPVDGFLLWSAQGNFGKLVAAALRNRAATMRLIMRKAPCPVMAQPGGCGAIAPRARGHRAGCDARAAGGGRRG